MEAPISPESPRPSRRRSPAGWLVLVLAALAIVELGARIYLYDVAGTETLLVYGSQQDLRDRPELARAQFRFAPHRYLGYVPRPGHRRGALVHNSQGYKDDEIVLPKPAGEFRIVCLGGPTTYASAVEDPRLSYPNRLEAELRERGYRHVNVINAGADGYSSYEFLPQYAFRVRYLYPDLVIVHAGFNDTLARLVWPASAYQPDNSGFRIDAAAAVVTPNLWDYSVFLRMAAVRSGLLAPASEHRGDHDPLNEATVVARELETQVGEQTYPRGVFAEASAEHIFATNGDEYFLRNMEALLVLLRHDDVRVVVSSEPMLAFDLDPAAKVEADEFQQPWFAEPLPGFAPFRQALEQSNAKLAALATRLGADWFDLAAALPRDRSLYTDGVHATEAGERLKGRMYADLLVERGLVPAAAP